MKLQVIKIIFFLSMFSLFNSQAYSNTVNSKLRLIRASSYFCPPVSGCTKKEFFQALVEVDNTSFEKQVEAMIMYPRGLKAIAAKYLGESTPGKELWLLNSSFNLRGFKFYLSYKVNGQSYRDDNNGNLYELRAMEETRIVHQDFPVLLDDTYSLMKPDISSYGLKDGFLQGRILVNNPSLNSNITIVYTTDSWTTVSTYEVNDLVNETSGGRNSVIFKIPLSGTFSPNQVKIAIRYNDENGEFWDNNFGKNYSITPNGKFSR